MVIEFRYFEVKKVKKRRIKKLIKSNFLSTFVKIMNIKKIFAEFVSTFVLVFCGCGAIVINNVTDGIVTHPGIAMTFGLVVIAMIFAFGELSGAHMNPAVSLSLYLDKKLDFHLLIPYIIAQIIGGITACILLRFLFPTDEYLGTTLPSGSPWQSFVLEVVLTFILMLTIYLTTSTKKSLGLMVAIPIGGVVWLEALFAGPITGASMNPARSIGPAFISGHLEYLWIYVSAPIIGAILALFVHKILR